MMMKYDLEDSGSDEEIGYDHSNDATNRGPEQKQARNDINQGKTTKNQNNAKAGIKGVSDNSTESLSTGTSTQYTDKIAVLEQQVKSQSEQLAALTNATPTSDTTDIDARFKTLQESITNNSTTIQNQLTAHATELTTILEKIELNDLKTTSRIDTVYDTISTNTTELDKKIQMVSEEVSESNIEKRADNERIESKLDKVLTHIASKSAKKLKSMQIAKQLNQTLMSHTGESAMDEEDDVF